jgi:excinuclease ABC subunit C
LVNELEQITGIGKQTVVSLLKHFKSVKRVSEASISELENVVGKNKASILKDYYQKKT